MYPQTKDRNIFSSRLPWQEEDNLLSQRIAASRDFIDLTEANPTRVGFAFPETLLTEVLSSPKALRYQPDPQGLEEAREAIACYYQKRGFAVKASQIWLTTSTSESYSLLFKLLCDAQQRVLVPAPSYPLFDFLAQLDLVRIRPYPLHYDARWHLAPHAFENLGNDDRAIVIVNPNNPTGSFLKKEDISILKKANLPMISDEVFGDYLAEANPTLVQSLLQTELSGFVLSGFSKVLGLPQLKLGWIVLHGDETFQQEAARRLAFLCDTYLSVSVPIQYACAPLLSVCDSLQGMIQHRVQRNAAYLRESLDKTSPCSLLRREGGWSVVLRIPAEPYREEAWVLRLLEEEKVLVHPGYFFDFPQEAFLVFGLLQEESLFREGVTRLLRGIHRVYGF